MAPLAARQLPVFNFFEAQLNSIIPIPLKGSHLSNVARASFDNRNRNRLALLVKHLRHANFLTQNCLHGTTFLLVK
jgi:hypothetical protein